MKWFDVIRCIYVLISRIAYMPTHCRDRSCASFRNDLRRVRRSAAGRAVGGGYFPRFRAFLRTREAGAAEDLQASQADAAR